MTNWQRMDTAPKDGTMILILYFNFGTEHVNCRLFWWHDDMWYDYDHRCLNGKNALGWIAMPEWGDEE